MKTLALLAALSASLLTGCVIAPPNSLGTTTDEAMKMTDRAVAVCGAGNVKEVSPKSFSCK